ncbi:hypothetical protein NECAME_10535 [Necator americanus]|uniref:Uncharacterized protein n=1 Tax=Necator americanus TaxID=51031 RepID=W2T812_NECAM|nr:hypothetical protein NECAME_10535 [Necator americanus]ETN78160.1 hypothetical protein NECAME_10535 [Necator americanus]
MHTETRSSRIRAAMFPDNEAEPSSDVPLRSTTIELMSVPTRVLNTAVLDLLYFEGTTNISTLPVPHFIDLMSDRDETVVARAVERVYLLSKEDSSHQY